MDDFLDELRRALAPGLDRFGVVSAARFDAIAPPHVRTDVLAPGARAVVVVGSTRVLWDEWLAWLAEDPRGRLATVEHPLDDFCRSKLQIPLLRGCTVLLSDAPIDLVKTAALAGLGHVGRFGLLVDRDVGPWFGLRAAIFTPWSLQQTAALPSPCEGCPAPCLVPEGHLERRLACVAGPDHRYGPLELAYHHDRAAGRAALCARFGVDDAR